MTPVYVDTGGFIALLWTRDRAHNAVAAAFRDLRRQGRRLVTSEPVVAETITRLRYDAGLGPVRSFARTLDDAGAELVVRESDVALRRRALDVMQRFADLPLSYADCVGAVVAREIGADLVLGLDADFRVLGFTLTP